MSYRKTLVITVVMLIGLCSLAYAGEHAPVAVPDASALLLAPMGIAAVLAAERRRRRMAKLHHQVGLAYFVVKRLADIVFAFIALVLCTPLVALLAVLIRLDSPGPVFFRRRAVGFGGRQFDMFKFRSMVEGAEEILAEDEDLKKIYYINCKIDSDPRITKLGAFLRKTSLDELPQFINILLGQMTFVGPRPIASDEVEIYGPEFERFKTVKPGVTGMWQTCGRSETSYDTRVKMDMLYIEKRSIIFDAWIVLTTIPAVLLKRGAM